MAIDSCSVGPLGRRFRFHLQDVSPKRAEFLFKVRLRWWAVAVGQLQSDICPVFRPQRVDHGGKHDTFLHGHMLPFVVDEVANDVVYGLSQQILVVQDAFDRLSNSAQTSGTLPMFGFQIADSRRCDRVAGIELSDDNILLRVMTRVRIVLEIVNDRQDDLVIR